jgi:putative ABC transport system permease protein
MLMLWTTLKIALGSLAGNKLRSILTMLGVIIGVGAVIAMLSLGSAFGDYISGQITSLGTNVVFVRAGQQRHGPMAMVRTLTQEDALAILALPGVRAASPLTMNSSTLKAGNKTSTTALVAGMAPSQADIRNIQIERGRLFTDAEVRREARVGVIAPKLAEDLFPGQDPVGRDLRIGNVHFRVIGLTKAVGDQGAFGNPDDQILIPYTTAMHQLSPRVDHLPLIGVSVVDRESLNQVKDDISDLLRRRHHLRPEEADDFSVVSMADVLDTFRKVSLGLTLFLGTVAAISLVVGGIGIMNIMLATVAERTREIGIRKALGAKDRDILRQFLIEALVITLGGGLIGLALGWGLMVLGGAVVQQWLKLSVFLQWWIVGLSIAISVAVGLVSGLYPAWRASRLDPIAALRYE